MTYKKIKGEIIDQNERLEKYKSETVWKNPSSSAFFMLAKFYLKK